jgi:hypothetical protein
VTDGTCSSSRPEGSQATFDQLDPDGQALVVRVVELRLTGLLSRDELARLVDVVEAHGLIGLRAELDRVTRRSL